MTIITTQLVSPDHVYTNAKVINSAPFSVGLYEVECSMVVLSQVLIDF